MPQGCFDVQVRETVMRGGHECDSKGHDMEYGEAGSSMKIQMLRGGCAAAIAVGTAATVLAVGFAFLVLPESYYTVTAGYGIYTGSILCAGAGAYATGIARAHALRRFGLSGAGKPPRWARVIGPCPAWLRWLSRGVLGLVLLYAAVVWLQTWQRQDSFSAEKLAALFAAFAAALSWNSAAILLAAANWLGGRDGVSVPPS